jgi:hypothetical protein
MKKIVISLIVLSFLVGMVVPALVSAQITESQCTMKRDVNTILGSTANCPGINSNSIYGTPYGSVNGATCCLFSSILNITSWVFMLLMVIVTLLIVIGAASIVTSGGKEESVKKGRDYITYALVGLGAALLSFMLPYILRTMLGA